jgi:A-macroglobulin receptor binding domain
MSATQVCPEIVAARQNVVTQLKRSVVKIYDYYHPSEKKLCKILCDELKFRIFQIIELLLTIQSLKENLVDSISRMVDLDVEIHISALI